MPNADRESDLFGADHLPEGFRYEASLLDEAGEQSLLAQMRELPFRDFEFYGFVGKRRVVSFGWRYDFNGGGLSKTEDMPSFLLPVREQAATFAKFPLRICNRFWSPSMEPGRPLDGTVIARSSATSSESRCYRTVPSGSGANREPDGSART